jgi:glycosyltransferase involved in cell wall biosynthesis
LREIMPLRVLSHGRNLGQSRAVRTGVRAAKAPIVVTLDGDGQNDPADIPKLLAAFRGAANDSRPVMVAGERTKREDSWKKRMASRYGNKVRRWLLSDNAKDTGCGLKVFHREAFLGLPYFDHMHRYLITLMLREGYEVRFMPVGHRPRGAGRSKYGVWDRALVGLSDLMGVMWLKRRFRGPDTPREW